MALKSDLEDKVAEIFRQSWSERDGEKVPEPEDLLLSNDAVKLQGTVLYADLADSTSLVDSYKPQFAAEIYKAFLHCAAKIITSEDGTITAYDGDRVMGVFIGTSKNTSAARCALKINYAMTEVIRPALKKQYPNTEYRPKHVVGIDTSDLYIARTGVRGANDLVWVGRAANYAAKLAARSESYASYITADVYNNLNQSVKQSNDGRDMWTQLSWDEFGNKTIYGSTWWWSVS